MLERRFWQATASVARGAGRRQTAQSVQVPDFQWMTRRLPRPSRRSVRLRP